MWKNEILEATWTETSKDETGRKRTISKIISTDMALNNLPPNNGVFLFISVHGT